MSHLVKLGIPHLALLGFLQAAIPDTMPFPTPVNTAALAARCGMDEAAEAMLRRNGFVVLDNVTETDLIRCYERAGVPIFVTTDAMLYLWYGLHRKLLKAAEKEALYPQLCQAVAALSKANTLLRGRFADPLSQTALRKAGVTLAVADQLLTESAKTLLGLGGEVDALAGKVKAHAEFDWYPGEDFTQYTVRGHYAESPELSRYFRGSMWLSRQFMCVDPDRYGEPDAPLRTAVAIAAVVRAAPEARRKLQAINAARQFLAGMPNATSVEQVISALDCVLGGKWTLTAALKPMTLASLRKELETDRYPKMIVKTGTQQRGGWFPAKVVSLLPDYAIPDCVLFQSTLHPIIRERSLPTGLEVAAALGSEVAERQVQTADRYGRQVVNAIHRHKPLVTETGRSVYDGWLHTLSTLFTTDPRAPEFMRNEAWRFEKTNTCLSSWANLRHAYILYAAQAHAMYGLGGGPPKPPEGLVEPAPLFYRALAGLARQTEMTLGQVGALSAENRKLLSELALKCREFEKCAEAELAGKLTEEQADRIANFASWVDTFHVATKPSVADVATGAKDEVLHAATGPLNPLLVIPDPSNKVAYIGWVMSYYEFVRAARQRLTDEEWQKMHATAYLRPDRPEWAGEFVSIGGGQEWKSRAPLRAAERLLLAEKPDEAVSLLRRAVADNPDSPLATEAQFRIGKLYLERRDYDNAETELRKCRSMYSCDASDEAKQLVGRIPLWRRTGLSAYEQELRKKQAQELAHIGSLLNDLKAASLTDAERESLERKMLTLLVTAKLGYVDAQCEQVLREAVAVCGNPHVREALDFEALMNPHRFMRTEEASEAERSVSTYIQFARRTRSPAFRAAALARAVDLGLHRENPRQALALLRPSLSADAFRPDKDPALALYVATVSSSGEDKPDPRELAMPYGSGDLLRDLIEEAYCAGQLETVMECLRMLPKDEREQSEIGLICTEFGDHGMKPLAAFATIRGFYEEKYSREAGPRCMEIYRRFPNCKLAPYVLLCAEACYCQSGHPQRAQQLAGILSRRFPKTYPGVLSRLHAAFDRGNVPETRRLAEVWDRINETDEYNRCLLYLMPSLYEDQVPNDAWRALSRHDAASEALAGIVKAAGKPDLLRRIPLRCEALPLAKQFAAALPDRAAEVYFALIKASSDPDLCRAFLAKFPDHPGKREAWWRLSWLWLRGGHWLPERHKRRPDPIPWIVLLVNGKLGEEHFDDACNALVEFVSREDVRATKALAKRVRGAAPGTRAALLADYALAKKLAESNRPEDALMVTRELLPRLSPEETFLPNARRVQRRAELELWAKRQPEWAPVWTVEVGKPAKELRYESHTKELAPSLTGQGMVFVSTFTGSKPDSLTTLDEDTGAEKWKAKTGEVCSLCLDPNGRLFCGTKDGALIALEASTGRTLYRKELATPGASSSVRVICSQGILVACLYAAPSVVAGLSPQTGEYIWRRDVPPLRGLPALRGGVLYVATTGDEVRAYEARSGNPLWATTCRTKTSGLRDGPFRIGDTAVLVYTNRVELRHASDGRLLRAIEEEEAKVLSGGRVVGSDFLVGWADWGAGGLVTLPDLRLHGLALPELQYGCRPVVSGRTLYVTAERGRLLAVDVDTGAVLAESQRRNYYPSDVAVGKYVYVRTRGEVAALPRVVTPPDPARASP